MSQARRDATAAEEAKKISEVKVVSREPGEEKVFKEPGEIAKEAIAKSDPKLVEAAGRVLGKVAKQIAAEDGVPESEVFEPAPTMTPQGNRLKLTELQISKLDALEWKLTAHTGRIKLAEEAMKQQQSEYNDVVGEWLVLCNQVGLDPNTPYNVLEGGVIEYELKPAPPGQKKFTKV